MGGAVFMFPGVGSHYSGMGKYFYDQFPAARHTFDEASDTLGMNMSSLCFDKQQEAALNQLEHAQSALVTVSVASFRVFMQEVGLRPVAMLGYSLGEYSALCCAGALEFTDALRLVHARGAIVSKHAASLDGTMAWATNVTNEIVARICGELREQGEEIYVSAFDTPYKSSVSGSTAAVRKAGELIVEHGGIAIPIKMSGPFHSPLMQPAADEYLRLLEGIRPGQLQVPVIANDDAVPYEGAAAVIGHLYRQLVSPVRWLDSLGCGRGLGMDSAIEIGPKTVLQYLMQAVLPDVQVLPWDKEKDVKKTRQQLVLEEDDHAPVIGRCLAVVAGTKNRGASAGEYRLRVVQPFEEIQDRLEACRRQGEVPPLADVQAALEMMRAALEAKRTPPEDLQRSVKFALAGKFLHIQPNTSEVR